MARKTKKTETARQSIARRMRELSAKQSQVRAEILNLAGEIELAGLDKAWAASVWDRDTALDFLAREIETAENHAAYVHAQRVSHWREVYERTGRIDALDELEKLLGARPVVVDEGNPSKGFTIPARVAS
jgi:hypothetical protein